MPWCFERILEVYSSHHFGLVAAPPQDAEQRQTVLIITSHISKTKVTGLLHGEVDWDSASSRQNAWKTRTTPTSDFSEQDDNVVCVLRQGDSDSVPGKSGMGSTSVRCVTVLQLSTEPKPATCVIMGIWDRTKSTLFRTYRGMPAQRSGIAPMPRTHGAVLSAP